MPSLLHRLHLALCLSKATNILQSVAQCQACCSIQHGILLPIAQHELVAGKATYIVDVEHACCSAGDG